MRARAESQPIRLAILAALVTAAATACASRAPAFGPAGVDESRRALDAWAIALERADSLGPARLLYDAKMSEGLVKVPGTLAVEALPGHLEATLTGPFGSPIARYVSGVLEAKGARPIPLEPEELRAVLAGVWRTPARVEGARAGESLLRFTGRDPVEAVLDVGQARLQTLKIERPEAELVATYSGRLDPWPERIRIEDRRTGKMLQLTLVAKEPASAPASQP
ncbi:MAG TPA: hypothetical protein VGS98_03375 [Thermoanaerobaculia bacterium]|nr:hypothetical protein [Thermoanaerobaculia bacterium]